MREDNVYSVQQCQEYRKSTELRVRESDRGQLHGATEQPLFLRRLRREGSPCFVYCGERSDVCLMFYIL